MTTRYFECQKCGRIHFGVNDKQAKEIAKKQQGEFSVRNLKHCSNCGSSYPFFEVNEHYVKIYSDENPLTPWLYPKDVDEPEQNTSQS